MGKLARSLSPTLLILGACASSPRPAVPVAPVAAAPARVDGANVSLLQRTLDETPPRPADASYRALRGSVAAYLSRRALDAAHTGDYDRALSLLREALHPYSADELNGEVLPDAMGDAGRALVQHFAPRGDEAHTLIGARILSSLEHPDPEGRATWTRVVEWGTRNRTEFQRSWVREGELSGVFVEVARTIPARDVLDLASEHLASWRREASEARALAAGQRLNHEESRWLRMAAQRPVLDTAMAYLRVGDVRAAANQVRALGSAVDLADDLGALAAGEGGAAALGALAERFERTDTTVMGGLCRLGRRTYPNDLRFARCLAATAARVDDFGLASAHLDAAVRLGERDQTILRAAIEATALWMRHEIGSDEISAGRAAYARTQELLGRWATRYEGQTPPLGVGDLETMAADLEFAGGNLAEARAHLRLATQATPPSRDGYFTLAEAAWRVGEHAEARRLLDEGVRLPLRPTESDSLFRPLFLLRTALVTKDAGEAEAADRLLHQASDAFEALGRSSEGPQLARVLLQRAQIADSLGDATAASEHLRAAMTAAPDDQDVAARAVTFALARGRWADARALSVRARAQLTLDRNWQVYFALWTTIASRMEATPDSGARAALEAIARDAGEQSAWTARIAQRYVGGLDRDALFRYARTPGQRCEAHFYEAMLRRAEGDASGATEDLRATVATNVLRYFEYELAWEMLRRP